MKAENKFSEIKVEQRKIHKHDMLFKEILQNEREMAQFIKKFVPQHEIQEEIDLQNGTYITKDFEMRESDIVYKVKDKEIYYLIEHQTKVDYTMPYRMPEYSFEIIRKAVKGKEKQKVDFKYPVVIPIVLYTGSRKWRAKTNFAECQVIKELGLDISYILVDINKISKKELLKENTMIANAFIFEKCKSKEEVFENLKEIAKNMKSKKEKENLKRVIMLMFDWIEKEEITKILENEEEKEMSTIRERLRDEYYQMKEDGIKENMLKIISNMIYYNMPEDDIIKYVGIDRKQLEKIKKELQE